MYMNEKKEYIYLSSEDFLSVCEVGMGKRDYAIVNSSSHGLLLFAISDITSTFKGYIEINDGKYELKDIAGFLEPGTHLRVVCSYTDFMDGYYDEEKDISVLRLIITMGEIIVDTNYYKSHGYLVVYADESNVI